MFNNGLNDRTELKKPEAEGEESEGEGGWGESEGGWCEGVRDFQRERERERWVGWD